VGGLWAMKSEGVRLIVRAISFQDFQPMWSRFSTYVVMIQQCHRQTDVQTTCDSKTALCTVVYCTIKTQTQSTVCVMGPHKILRP